FLDHFHRTSLIADDTDGLRGFLVGLISPDQPDQAYIHFVGVHPAARRTGLAGELYDRFFQLAREHGRSVIQAITSPVNETSVAFHRRLGFSVTGPVPDYNGPGRDLIVFDRSLQDLPGPTRRHRHC